MTRILIIEDEPDMRGNLADVLRLEGYEPIIARTGKHGVELARQCPPDLIICDVMMPGMDGHGVLAALRAETATARTPFIFLTAKGERRDVRAGMNHGADDYLIKPVSLEDLLHTVRTRLERRKAHVLERGAPVFDSPAPLQALGLSPREAEILFWTAQGKTNEEIGVILKVTRSTVKKHLENIFRKTGTAHRTEVSLLAMERLGCDGRQHVAAESPSAAHALQSR